MNAFDKLTQQEFLDIITAKAAKYIQVEDWYSVYIVFRNYLLRQNWELDEITNYFLHYIKELKGIIGEVCFHIGSWYNYHNDGYVWFKELTREILSYTPLNRSYVFVPYSSDLKDRFAVFTKADFAFDTKDKDNKIIPQTAFKFNKFDPAFRNVILSNGLVGLRCHSDDVIIGDTELLIKIAANAYVALDFEVGM